MKLREQASLGCKLLALLCFVEALGSLQQSVPQAVGGLSMGMRGGGSSITAGVLLAMCAPAILMSLAGVALWGVSPFIASLMIPNAVVEKTAEDTSAFTSSFDGRAAMKIALMVMGLWLCVQASIGAGTVLSLRAVVAALSATPNSTGASIASMYEYQMNGQMIGAALHGIFGILFLFLSGPLSRRAFPD